MFLSPYFCYRCRNSNKLLNFAFAPVLGCFGEDEGLPVSFRSGVAYNFEGGVSEYPASVSFRSLLAYVSALLLSTVPAYIQACM